MLNSQDMPIDSPGVNPDGMPVVSAGDVSVVPLVFFAAPRARTVSPRSLSAGTYQPLAAVKFPVSGSVIQPVSCWPAIRFQFRAVVE